MPRSLPEIIFHIRAVVSNPAVSTTLIQTEDLEALCNAAEQISSRREEMVEAILARHLRRSIEMFPDAAGMIDLAKTENESYRPYAEADVDAIIDALTRGQSGASNGKRENGT